MTKASSKAIVGLILPNIEEASIMAVTISEKNNLSENEQAFFIAGFQECIKWINSKNTINPKSNLTGDYIMSTLHKNENMENNLITIVISEYNPNLILFLREQLVKIGFKFISAVYDPIKDEHYFNMEKPIQNEG